MGDSFTTSKGITVEFVPIMMLIDKLNSGFAQREPEPPYYEIKTATGAVERHVHDETTVSTDEEKAALVSYHADKLKLDAERAEKMTQLYLLRGVKVDMPGDDVWVKEQEFLGIPVPTDKHERTYHWITTEVIGTLEDLRQIMAGVGRASGVPEEYLQQAEHSFRRALGESNGDEAGGPAKATPADGEGVVLQPTVRAGESGSTNGNDGESVRHARRKR